MTYSFSLTLAGVDEMTTDMAEALFEATDHDCTPASSGGVAAVHFDRAAGDLGEAVGVAIREVEKAGYKVAKVEVEELAPVG
jgi:hypothetical protein